MPPTGGILSSWKGGMLVFCKNMLHNISIPACLCQPLPTFASEKAKSIYSVLNP